MASKALASDPSLSDVDQSHLIGLQVVVEAVLAGYSKRSSPQQRFQAPTGGS